MEAHKIIKMSTFRKLLKGGEKKMKTIEKTVKVYCDNCSLCGKQICGNNEKEINYNMMIHKMAKHSAEQKSSNKI